MGRQRDATVERLAAFPARLAGTARRVEAGEPGGPPTGEWSAREVMGHLVAVVAAVWQARLDQLAAVPAKPAWFAQRAEAPANLLCTLGVDDNTWASGERRCMMGREPICRPGGGGLEDRNGRRTFVTTGASGPSVGKHLLMAYLPIEEAVVGNRLAVESIGELYPVTVLAAGPTGVFDPENARMLGGGA